MKTLRLKEQTHEKLGEIRKEIVARNGESKTYDQVIKELIDFWKKGIHDNTTTSTKTGRRISISKKATFRSDRPPPSTIDPHLLET